jgi:lipopolysaccharide/colanic/teichoic acid biosynthesis glycosyltransferase
MPIWIAQSFRASGLTGWAQVHARDGTPDSLSALEYDLYYVKHLCAAMDAFFCF